MIMPDNEEAVLNMGNNKQSVARKPEHDLKLWDILDRHKDFWHRRSVSKPLIGLSRFAYFPLEDFDIGIEDGLILPKKINLSNLLRQYDRLFSNGGLYMGDLLWAASPLWGLPWLEAIIGCDVEVRRDDLSLWAKRVYNSIEDVGVIKLSNDNDWFILLLEFIGLLAENSAGQYPLATPLMRGPVDMLAALIGTEQLAYAAYDNPKKVRILAEQCANIFVTVAKAQIERMPKFYGGYSQMQHVWAPGATVMTQQDASIFFTPTKYRELILPADRIILDAFEYTMMHFHSSTLHTLDDFLELDELECIEIVVDPSGPELEQLVPAFSRIQEFKPLVIFADFNPNQLDFIMDQLSPIGLCIYIKHATT
jgi:hypothetical protein